jgi:hypothetical protein
MAATDGSSADSWPVTVVEFRRIVAGRKDFPEEAWCPKIKNGMVALPG